jgi:CubicO group peptidase (beta-lactamase class C family)
MQNPRQYPIHGTVAAGFEPVREVFERNFTDDVDVGASVCIVHDGETLVDLWGGYRDAAGETPWTSDTLVNVYSTTKGIAAIAFATLVEEGLLDYSDPVRDYWPELEATRDGLSVGDLLAHKGGLCGVDAPLAVADLYNWPKMVRLLEKQKPHWTPGTAAGYHAITWGYLPGELARRLTGKTLSELIRERLAQPFEAEFHLGLPPELADRVAPMIGPNRARKQPDLASLAGLEMPALYPIALQNPVIRPFQDASSAAWQQAEIAAANGQANARGIARIYAAALDTNSGPVGPRTAAALVEERVGMADDLVLGRPMRRGAGVILNTAQMYGPGERSWGHSGAGGSIGFADPDNRVAFGYAMNQMQNNIDDDTRGGRLLRAFYACLEAG